MQDGWTTERVLQLAPDPASAKAGQGLGSARKWATLARDADVLWGECQGSGAKPYQVRVDLAEPAFKCSCPSRKFPCKHSIGLMLIHAGGAVAAGAKPQWVEEWLAGRADRVKKKQEKAEQPPKPVDAEAQASRRAKRLERVGQGLAATTVWVEDLVRAGVASAPSQGYEFFDAPARRLVDAQAPGAARMVRELGSLAGSGAGWQEPFVSALASLHLLAHGVAGMDQLPPDTADDLLAAAGIAQDQDHVLAQPGVRDAWQIVAREVEVEDRLRAQKTWLFGTTTRRPALVLNFAHGAAPLDPTLPPGTCFDGELCFFGANQPRAAVKVRSDPRPITDMDGFPSLDSACAAYGDWLARQPWLGEVTVPLRAVVPIKSAQGWEVIDAQGRALPAAMTDARGWVCAAVAGGRPIDLAAAFDGHRLRPLALFADGEYVPLFDSTGTEP